MKWLTAVVLTLLLGYLVYLFNDTLAWWAVALAAAIAGAAVPMRAWAAFLSGFVGVGLLWGLLAYSLSAANADLMARRMAEVLPLKGNAQLLMGITALVGALVGGFSALAGHYLRRPVASSKA